MYFCEQKDISGWQTLKMLFTFLPIVISSANSRTAVEQMSQPESFGKGQKYSQVFLGMKIYMW